MQTTTIGVDVESLLEEARQGETHSTDYGYNVLVTLVDNDYEFVPVGEMMRPDYYYVDSSTWGWRKLEPEAKCRAIDPDDPPFFRPRQPARWSCGHGRDPGDTRCEVCAVVYFRIVTD